VVVDIDIDLSWCRAATATAVAALPSITTAGIRSSATRNDVGAPRSESSRIGPHMQNPGGRGVQAAAIPSRGNDPGRSRSNSPDSGGEHPSPRARRTDFGHRSAAELARGYGSGLRKVHLKLSSLAEELGFEWLS
jgi:hypothetical protein